MSWDVSLYKFSRQYKSLDEIPNDEQALSLGTLAEFQRAVSDIFPSTNWDDSIWGIFDSDIGSIEFNVGNDDPVTNVMLHVRASSAVVAGILQLCNRLSCQAIDLTDSSFLDQSPHPEAGLRTWQNYLNQVLKTPPA